MYNDLCLDLVNYLFIVSKHVLSHFNSAEILAQIVNDAQIMKNVLSSLLKKGEFVSLMYNSL